MSIEGHLGPITPLEAEYVAAAIMRDHLGFEDARVTTASGDGGIDVVARQAVAQVKHWGSQVGRPAIQQLYGARGIDHSKKMIFFCSGGYSRQAVAYADEVGVALFTFDAAGSFGAVNKSAQELGLAARRLAEKAKKKAELEEAERRAVIEAERAERAAQHAKRAAKKKTADKAYAASVAHRQARIDVGDIPLVTVRSGCALPFVLLATLGFLAEFKWSSEPDPSGLVLITIFGTIALLFILVELIVYLKLKRAHKRKRR